MRRAGRLDPYRPSGNRSSPGLWWELAQCVCFAGCLVASWLWFTAPAFNETTDTIEARRAALRSFEDLASRVAAVHGTEHRMTEQEREQLAHAVAELREDWHASGLPGGLVPAIGHVSTGAILSFDERVAPQPAK